MCFHGMLQEKQLSEGFFICINLMSFNYITYGLKLCEYNLHLILTYFMRLGPILYLRTSFLGDETACEILEDFN